MKYIRTYKIFESIDDQFFKTKKEVEDWLNRMGIYSNYLINDNLIVDVKGNINLNHKEFEYLPIQFGKIIDGHFNINRNCLLTLKGCPYSVSTDFSCSYNNLKSLKYSPVYVGHGFYCRSNKLKSLEGCPKIIKGDFAGDNNELLSLNDIEFRGNIDILNNPFFDLKDILLNSRVGTVETHEDFLLLLKYLEEYKVIQGNKIYLSRLKDALYMIDREDFPIKFLSQYKRISNYYDVID